jgi:hypothetical protein
MLDAVPNTDMTYNCELGELYFDEIKNTTFEDTPTENVTINTSEFKIFRKYYDTIPTWAPKKIKELKEIIDSTDKKDLSL